MKLVNIFWILIVFTSIGLYLKSVAKHHHKSFMGKNRLFCVCWCVYVRNGVSEMRLKAPKIVFFPFDERFRLLWLLSYSLLVRLKSISHSHALCVLCMFFLDFILYILLYVCLMLSVLNLQHTTHLMWFKVSVFASY